MYRHQGTCFSSCIPLCCCSATVHPIKVTVDPKSVGDPTLAVELYKAVDSKVIVHARAVVIDLSGAVDSRVAVDPEAALNFKVADDTG